MCGLPIAKGEIGLRHFGFFTAHSEHRCLQLLQMKIAKLEAKNKLALNVVEAAGQLREAYPPSGQLLAQAIHRFREGTE